MMLYENSKLAEAVSLNWDDWGELAESTVETVTLGETGNDLKFATNNPGYEISEREN